MTSDVLKNVLMSYLEEDKSPHFAVMIDGEWGSGKSHFIKKNFLDTLNKGMYEVCYVSLYNISSISDLEKSIYYTMRGENRRLVKQIIDAGKDMVNKIFGYDLSFLDALDIPKIFCRNWLVKKRVKD